MSLDHSPAIPITALTYDELRQALPNKRGWLYPDRLISRYALTFDSHQRKAIAAALWLSRGLALSSIVLAVWKSWWWLLLILGAVLLRKMARTLLRDFFIINMENQRDFFDMMRESHIADDVQLVLRN